MNHAWLCAAVGCGVLVVSTASAERCIGPKDNTVGVEKGVSPINPADITWCDDFDSYCVTNCGDCEAGNPASVWPGYPPVPDNVCTDPLDADESFFRKPYHWPPAEVSNPVHGSSSVPGDWSAKWKGWEGWDFQQGWTTGPYTLLYQGGSNTSQYHTFNLEPAAGHKFAGMNAMNGTDANPLVLRFWMHPAEGSVNLTWAPGTHPPGKPPETPPNLPFYVELRLENDHAPTEYVMRNCAPEAQGPYPMICQQRTIPQGCPTTLSTQVHASMAFGWLSLVDTNPCDVENGRKPTSYHASVFDGVRWTELRNNVFSPQVGGFNWDSGLAYFEMKVKSSVVEIKLIAYVEALRCFDPACDDAEKYFALKTSTATVPRRYTGPFNRISLGAAPGCEVNAAGECISQPDVWRYMQDHSSWGWSNVYVDNVALLGGVGESVNGACCLPDGTCSETGSLQCQAAGGDFRGIQTTCASGACLGACCEPKGVCTQKTNAACSGFFAGAGSSCEDPNVCPCPTPFADADMDGDVDMNDFATFQRCLTGGYAIGPGCGCFDKDQNGTVDALDLELFAKCATGEGIPWASSEGCP